MAEQSQPTSELPHPLLVEQLRDLYLPETPTWWTIVSDRWWLLAIGTGLLLFCMVKIFKLWRRPAKESELKSTLDQAYQEWRHHKSESEYLKAVGLILRAYGVESAGRESVAKLSGTEWVQWLEQHQQASLSNAASQALSEHCYQLAPATNIDDLHRELQQWAQPRLTDNTASQHA